jgi:hypothetical protein
VQLDIVAVLCLLALFTNEHLFWFAALLLAFIDFPDFLTPVQRIASAAERIAGQETTGALPDDPSRTPVPAETPHPIEKGSTHA